MCVRVDGHTYPTPTHLNYTLFHPVGVCALVSPWNVPFLIEYFSGFMTLQPGDLILTGTPDGVVDCQPGDVVVTEIEGIAALMNTISSS
jgi:5-oxopent-3-ene-1,2,5-tricarboxylate decarboxylase/2-hydroxyhepta-2,4-diene-1,7-dioate isomerase